MKGICRLLGIGSLLFMTTHTLIAQDLPDWFQAQNRAEASFPWEDEATGYVSGYNDRHQPTLPSALPLDSRYLATDEIETSQTNTTATSPAQQSGGSPQPLQTTTQSSTTETQESQVPSPPATFEGGVPGWMEQSGTSQDGASSYFQGAVPTWMEGQSSSDGNGTIPQPPATFDGAVPSSMDQPPPPPAPPNGSSVQPWMVGDRTPQATPPPPPSSSKGGAAQATPHSEVLYQQTTSPQQVEQQKNVQVVYPGSASPSQQLQVEAAKQGYRINFQNVPILEYIRWVGQISRTNFIYEPSELQFSVTIVSEEPTSIENIMAALLQVLRVHGLSMAEQGNNILIYVDANMGLAAIAPVVDSAQDQASPAAPPIITRVYRVYSASPAALAAIITPLLSAEAIVEPSVETGHLVITDIKANIDKVSELLQALDSPKVQVEIIAYHVQYADTAGLTALVEQIMTPIAAGQPFEMVANAPAKTIFIMSTPYLDEQAVSLLEKLDVPTAEETKAVPPSRTHVPQQGGPQGLPPSQHNVQGTNFEIYKLQYNDGDDIVTSLREIAASLTAAGGVSSELVQTIRTIQWIKASNSLVVSGAMAAINQTVELIEQLDVPLKQVLIEMLVIKTDLENSLAFGVEWGTVGQAGADFSGAAGYTPSGVGTYTSPNIRPNFPAGSLGLLPGLAANAIGSIIHYDSTHFWSIQALVSAVEAESNIEVITNQKLLVQDSKTATVFVGQQIAFSEGTIAFGEGSDFATSSFDYRDIGTSMEITPYIGNGPIITLEISQEVSETLTPVTGNSGSSSGGTVQNPTTDKTTTSTRVHIPDHHFLIIAGQIRGENQTVRSGLPCLGTLPFVGGVFSNTSDAAIKNNLIILIRPHVVATVQEMDELTRDQRHEFEEWNTVTPLHLNLREWLNLPNTCRPFNMPEGRCDPQPCVYP